MKSFKFMRRLVPASQEDLKKRQVKHPAVRGHLELEEITRQSIELF